MEIKAQHMVKGPRSPWARSLISDVKNQVSNFYSILSTWHNAPWGTVIDVDLTKASHESSAAETKEVIISINADPSMLTRPWRALINVGFTITTCTHANENKWSFCGPYLSDSLNAMTMIKTKNEILKMRFSKWKTMGQPIFLPAPVWSLFGFYRSKSRWLQCDSGILENRLMKFW